MMSEFWKYRVDERTRLRSAVKSINVSVATTNSTVKVRSAAQVKFIFNKFTIK